MQHHIRLQGSILREPFSVSNAGFRLEMAAMFSWDGHFPAEVGANTTTEVECSQPPAAATSSTNLPLLTGFAFRCDIVESKSGQLMEGL